MTMKKSTKLVTTALAIKFMNGVSIYKILSRKKPNQNKTCNPQTKQKTPPNVQTKTTPSKQNPNQTKTTNNQTCAIFQVSLIQKRKM